MKTVIIMRGIPGSGKSTYIKTHYPDAIICSADSYFMRNDKYDFDASKLGAAHGACMRKFIEALTSNQDCTVVVDNTNIKLEHIAPYVGVAEAYGARPLIIELRCSVDAGVARNVHGVPYNTVAAARANMDKLPKNWNVYTLDT